jgi:cytochrome c biogenesis protein CcmG, thiol:disulfide interchange protein DsbE
VRLTRIIAAAALLALLAACPGGKAEPGGKRCVPNGLLGEGDVIPQACSFPMLDGSGTLTLAGLAGKPAVINFWATWCVFCIKEMPAFERVHKTLGDRVAFVGADLVGIEGETAALGRSYAADRGVTYRLIVDEDGLLYAHFVQTSATRTPVLPTTIFVDSGGRIAFRQFGPFSESELVKAISAKLGVT